MRGGGWDMSSSCVRSSVGGVAPAPVYQNNLMMGAHSPVQAWPITQHTTVKQEPLDTDSSAYCSGSDGFHSSSPGGSDNNSRDSNTITNSFTPAITQTPQYFSTPVPNRYTMPTSIPYQQNMNGFNPLTPPSFEPMISPKMHSASTAELSQKIDTIKTENLSPYQISENPSLTPCTTPPTEDTPPKSPKNTPSSDGENENYYEAKSEGEDHLRRLQMAFEKNNMLPGSPKGSDKDSGEDDGKSDYEMDEVDEQGLRVPRVNSHGKVKTFKCKQCEFVAVTKLDFWEHSRGHIKVDKLLTCPKCPFVTEYKHHLEYHLRNHFGSKPFKCDKCSYSCVNKSMLNSHLKSHSNVYQYRCADCTYATKYCHSLKLHLRKYNHSPAMVLNADGTPNPLPIIDVYGTRRGPKQKSQKNIEEEQQTPSSMIQQHSIFPHFMMANSQQGPMSLPFPYPLLGAFPGALNNSLLFPQMNHLQEQVSPNTSPQHLNERSSPELMIEDSPDSPIKNHEEDRPASSPQPENNSALDLSKPEITLPINVPQVPAANPVTPAAGNKNRRKGRAFKLVTPTQMSSDEEEPAEKICKVDAILEEDKVTESPKKSDIYNCQYCDIAFRDIVMYTMHMGYHGYKDPFTCNMCGEQSEDKVSFFLHIARTSHS